MDMRARLSRYLCDFLGFQTANLQDGACEVRIREGRPSRIRMVGGSELVGNAARRSDVEALMRLLTQDSLYARESEMCQGYFSASGGMRVGICGHVNAQGRRIRRISGVSSLCIRIPRAVRGCADALADALLQVSPSGLLILSPPGCGKTTLLRDLARALSERGKNVAIADERREIAACEDGVPTLDVGARTDVMDGCPKVLAIPLLVRACAPDVLIADEIGGMDDASAILDAARCGVSVAASAHAASLADALARSGTRSLIDGGAVRLLALLGPRPGEIREIRNIENGEIKHAEGNPDGADPDRLRVGGQADFQCPQTARGNAG